MGKKILALWNKPSLIVKIFAGIVLGVLRALLVPKATFFAVLGDVFIGALKAAAPVLVALLVAASISKANRSIGRKFSTVIVLYLLSTLTAALVAVLASNLFPVQLVLSAAAENAAPSALNDVFRTLLLNVVQNPVSALAEGNYIGILFWSILIGLALRVCAGEATLTALSDLADGFSKIVAWVISLAPFGILGIVFKTVSQNGIGIFTTYGRLLLLLVGTMAFCALVVNPLITALLLHRNPYPLVFCCLRESGLSALLTRSSAANIPINMKLCEKLGIEKDFYSVSIPLGSTVNMDGAAVTITVMALAAANTVGVHVPIPMALALCAIATLAACGTSGVAGGSLLLIPMACSFLGIGNDAAMQVVSVGFIISVVQDSVETALNSSGDVLFTAAAEYYLRRRSGQDMRYLGSCAKQKAK